MGQLSRSVLWGRFPTNCIPFLPRSYSISPFFLISFHPILGVRSLPNHPSPKKNPPPRRSTGSSGESSGAPLFLLSPSLDALKCHEGTRVSVRRTPCLQLSMSERGHGRARRPPDEGFPRRGSSRGPVPGPGTPLANIRETGQEKYRGGSKPHLPTSAHLTTRSQISPHQMAHQHSP